ncbi:universal stress protein [Streptomyces sp. NPDC059389]|uniref:universal stress protein n=1 Tax=Streptomyces sp. NPDC059389 TaxID=3346818 RepID=UPI0036CDFD28
MEGTTSSPELGVDGSDTDGRVLYVSAKGIEHVRRAGRELLDATVAAVTEQFPGLQVNPESSRSAPVPSLHRSVGLHDTIVVGSRGLGGFSSLMFGSVGLKVAAGATTTVIIVRGTESDAPDTGVVLAAVLGPTRGRVTRSLVHHAHCPVELIPRHTDGHGSAS